MMRTVLLCAQAAMVVCLLAGTLLSQSLLLDAAAGFALAAVALQWRHLGPLPRIFVGIGIACALGVAILRPDQVGQLRDALRQGVAFAALLSVLGMLRHPVRRSPLMLKAAHCLLRVPTRRRYAAVNVGGHVLSLLFNVGIIPLLDDLLAHEDDRRPDPVRRRHLLLAGMRGTVLMTLWSPMGVGFAIVTTSIPTLDPVPFMALAFATSMVFLAATCMAGTAAAPGTSDEGRAPNAAVLPQPLVLVLLATLALLALAVGLHEISGLSFILATVFVLPVFALFWLLAEPTPAPLRRDLADMLAGMNDMRTEAAIYLSAAVIGTAISLAIREQGVWQDLQTLAPPGLAVLFVCLLAIPMAGAAFLPHSVLVILLAQLLGTSALGLQHPMSLALALMCAWAIAIALSPISAMSLMTGALTRTPPYVVSLRWNLGFAAMLMILSMAVVATLYGLGY
ncbi:hypothetical protein LRX75_02150 [Rhizobium sp. DKSPLA3]|uniref:H+/citrate symporter n=1 Tax=Rhizobium quercicola TaxID=2901226 RepID=A0A9X1NPV4_9HYPH|nr:hypothetical protein [Rhizobium quercicola]MCD7107834.1 hypothetical protein [Rhizobium quercicola]